MKLRRKEDVKRKRAEAEENVEALKQQKEELIMQNRKLIGDIDFLSAELTGTRNSFTYKLGRLITWLPRKIIGLFKK